ncbi:hypothetical protein LDO31_13910 [Luteimonas sp. XNQY3]|nr:hypothetical protein [Luteimonas sp. XNQY3]MCD9007309.1 hypothetical protein [Luteimonas sp. XNQY3]
MSAASSQDTDFAALRASLLSRFEAELREQRDIDAASRESMLARMDEALQQQGQSGTGDASAGDVRAEVTEAIQMLNQHGLLDSAGGEEVERAFTQVYSVFENDAVNRALEFARISRENGEDAARAWLALNAAPASAA